MVLRLADADDVPTLDPAAGYDTVSWTFEQAIFDFANPAVATGVEVLLLMVRVGFWAWATW